MRRLFRQPPGSSRCDRRNAADKIDKAVRDVALFSLATPITIILTAYLLGDVDAHLLGLAILFAGGTFLYVATVDVLPDVHNSETGRQALFQVLIGAGLMVLLIWGLDATGLVAH